MEGQGTEEIKKSESDAHLTSAAAFVEGGIQDACDDACSICLEDFDTDPSTVTSCKHEFHLQCILEWCQRSSQCPMCWQPISLKDPTSQELLEAVERERSFRFNPAINATIFHHPTLGDFELQHLPVGSSDAELEERIIQHLAAAAAMGRARHIARREGHRNRGSSQNRPPQYLYFSTHPNAPSSSPASTSPPQSEENEPISAISAAFPSPANTGVEPSRPITSITSTQVEPSSASTSGLSVVNPQGHSSNNRSPNQSAPASQDRPGPSDLQSFSESLKSRFNAVSTRYKESISKSTRGWKERFFSRNTSMADLGTEVKREVNAGIATVSRIMERLETRENNRTGDTSVSNSVDSSVPASDNRHVTTTSDGDSVGDTNAKASSTAGSSSS